MKSLNKATKYLEALDTYIDREGTARVPVKHMEGTVPLGRWVSSIRTYYRLGELQQDMIIALEGRADWAWVLQPGPKSKSGRNTEIVAMRSSGVTLQVIGETYGLSRQRVHQILVVARRREVEPSTSPRVAHADHATVV